MVRASRAPGRAAEGRRARSRQQPMPAGRAVARTSLYGSRTPGRRGGQAPRRADSANGSWGRRGAEGAPASLRGARLASRRAVLPAASAAALGLRGTLPGRGAGASASVPRAPPPRDRTSTVRSPKETARGTRTHTQCPRAAPAPARPLSVSVRILSFPLLGGGRVRSPRRARSGGERGSREAPPDGGRGAGPGRGGSRRVGGAARGVAGRRAQGGLGSGRRVGPLARPPRGRERRNEALGGSAPGRDPTVPSPRAPPPPPPPPRARGRF
nr:uncharacterized protein LOC105881735 [Microcebus murinus]